MSHVEIFCLHHLGSDPASDFLSLLFLFLPAAFCPLLFSARPPSCCSLPPFLSCTTAGHCPRAEPCAIFGQSSTVATATAATAAVTAATTAIAAAAVTIAATARLRRVADYPLHVPVARRNLRRVGHFGDRNHRVVSELLPFDG